MPTCTRDHSQARAMYEETVLPVTSTETKPGLPTRKYQRCVRNSHAHKPVTLAALVLL